MKTAAIFLYICFAPTYGPSAPSAEVSTWTTCPQAYAKVSHRIGATAPRWPAAPGNADGRDSPSSGLDDYLSFHGEAKWGTPSNLMPWPTLRSLAD